MRTCTRTVDAAGRSSSGRSFTKSAPQLLLSPMPASSCYPIDPSRAPHMHVVPHHASSPRRAPQLNGPPTHSHLHSSLNLSRRFIAPFTPFTCLTPLLMHHTLGSESAMTAVLPLALTVLVLPPSPLRLILLAQTKVLPAQVRKSVSL